MPTKIDANELLEILRTTPSGQNIMLSGRHGIGKSRILRDHFESEGFRVVALFLGQMSDPGDLIGLPRLDEATGKTVFMPPYWFPTDGEPIVLLLDELNRARPEILQAVMDLTLNRVLAGRPLPEGSRVISAVNDGGEYQLTDLDPALVSRFNVYEFRPTAAEWLLWAARSGIDRRVVDFISENPGMLDGEAYAREDQGLEKSPDRRGWERVSEIVRDRGAEPLLKKVVAGIVGMPAAAKFFASMEKNRLLSAKEILFGSFAKAKPALKRYSTPDLAAVNDSLFRYLETQPVEAEKEREKAAKNLRAYYDFLLAESRREACAHFANLYSSSTCPNAILFVVSNCPDLCGKMAEFVESL